MKTIILSIFMLCYLQGYSQSPLIPLDTVKTDMWERVDKLQNAFIYLKESLNDTAKFRKITTNSTIQILAVSYALFADDSLNNFIKSKGVSSGILTQSEVNNIVQSLNPH